MLVLSRKVEQVICIGDDVRITIVEIGESNVRIGIDAPQTVRILREELTDGYEPASNPGPDRRTRRQ